MTINSLNGSLSVRCKGIIPAHLQGVFFPISCLLTIAITYLDVEGFGIFKLKFIAFGSLTQLT